MPVFLTMMLTKIWVKLGGIQQAEKEFCKHVLEIKNLVKK